MIDALDFSKAITTAGSSVILLTSEKTESLSDTLDDRYPLVQLGAEKGGTNEFLYSMILAHGCSSFIPTVVFANLEIPSYRLLLKPKLVLSNRDSSAVDVDWNWLTSNAFRELDAHSSPPSLNFFSILAIEGHPALRAAVWADLRILSKGSSLASSLHLRSFVLVAKVSKSLVDGPRRLDVSAVFGVAGSVWVGHVWETSFCVTEGLLELAGCFNWKNL